MADSASISASNTENEARSAAPKFTRCRTGCLRCRKRRRKCDERKPRCQNCIDKNFDCNYGMQVTFLPKNSITVTAGELKSADLDKDRKESYGRIQFINEDPLAIDNLAGTFEESGSVLRSHSPASSTSVLSAPISPLRVSDGRRPSNAAGEPFHATSTPTVAPWALTNLINNPAPPVTLEPRIPSSTFSAKDEFAVRGLLALGTQPSSESTSASASVGPSAAASAPAEALPASVETPGPSHFLDHDLASGATSGSPPLLDNTPGRTIPGGEISPGFIDGILGISSTAVPAPTSASAVHNPPAPLGFGLVAQGHTNGHNYHQSHTYSYTNGGERGSSNSELWKMKLLQHYRYNVAPWLDICDLTHSFGITALQMAVASEERLLPALLALSEASVYAPRSHGVGPGSGRGFQAVHFDDTTTPLLSEHSNSQSRSHGRNDLEMKSDPNHAEIILLRVLEELRELVSDVSRAWAKADGGAYGYGTLQSLAHSAYGLGLDPAMYWMFLRMDLGKSMANNTPLRSPLPSHPIPSLALLCRTENTHSRVGHYAEVLLWLCGKALRCYHGDQYEDPAPSTESESWLQVFDELTQWHYLRPQEFQPMVELGPDETSLNPESEFPMLLFTNGAGALCNQLYHTAMLYMLECKPRTALLASQQSPVLSPLWHTQRVCGIALNNDRRQWWDPCLLASFLVAARHMTHEAQRFEIVDGFRRVQELTGWGVGEYLTQLREEWAFLDGVE
ncbi:hypothetical protein BJX63DRAFT_431073 [Aspergillus granulosus]|uniref:Zn(2)-C6 fungal-type domain-containing protein n=1 Tax=Aspergillus granulosus TaxID=176169 RepID=A0ABR4HHK4_9EURO